MKFNTFVISLIIVAIILTIYKTYKLHKKSDNKTVSVNHYANRQDRSKELERKVLSSIDNMHNNSLKIVNEFTRNMSF